MTYSFANPTYLNGFGGITLPNNYTDLSSMTNWGRTSFVPQNNIDVNSNPYGITPNTLGINTNNSLPSWMPEWLKGAVGTPDNPGWGGLALGTAKGLSDMFMGMKQYGLAKKEFNFKKDAYNREYNTQANLTNAALADRQQTRFLDQGGAGYATARSVDDYMRDYGVKRI